MWQIIDANHQTEINIFGIKKKKPIEINMNQNLSILILSYIFFGHNLDFFCLIWTFFITTVPFAQYLELLVFCNAWFSFSKFGLNH